MTELFKPFFHSVKLLCPKLGGAELDYLQSGLTVTELPSKYFYMHAHTVQHEIGFVVKGLLRSFYIDQNGHEITVGFVRENSYATHYSAFITRMPCKYYFQCIEPTVMVNLSYDHIQAGYDKFPNIERYGRLVAEEVLKVQQRRIERFLFNTAEERYLEFIREHPDLFQRVSISHLASYLGIERQTLTRIRKKLLHS